MRKHIIRVLIVMFAACLGLAVFAGCTNEGEKQTYTVSYAAGGGTGTAPAAEKYEEGATFKVKENPFTYEGHTFKTWNDGTKDVAAGSDYTMPAKNVTFTAKWEDNSAEQVTVTFSLGDYKEGTAPQAQKVKKGGDVTLPTPPTWEGHTFLGWKIGDDAALKQAGLKVAVNADVTATAQWELAKEQVTVSFDLGGVEPLNKDKPETAWATPEAVKTNKDEEYTLPFAPAWWAGHMFAGWKVDDGAVKKAGEKITPSANVKLTAQWKEEQSITGATLDVTDDAVYVVISGQYEGYTDAAMLDALENCNQRVLCISVCLNHSPYDYQELDIQFEAEGGIYTATIDVTGLEKDGYSICECINSYGDVKSVTCDVTETLNNVKYHLSGTKGNNLTLTISDASKEYAFTSMKLEAETDKVYLTIGGTFSGYTADEFKGLLEDDDIDKLDVGFAATAAVGDLGKWKRPNCERTVTTTSEGTFEIKFDVTEIPIVAYTVCENQSGSGDIAWNDSFACTVTLGSRKYTVEKNGYGNAQLKVEATSTPTPPAEVTFSEPTSVTLEVSESDGREEGKLFREKVDAAFIVFSGTYTGEATDAIAQDYFSAAKYNFKFIGKDQKDRLRRISIDTEKKTWTLKFDITPLPATDNKCVLKGADLKLPIPADATKEVKALGSTFSIKNDADGVLIVNVVHNYTITGVDLELSEENVPYLVMKGSFEKDKFTAAEIEKFLKDDDVRTLCLNLTTYVWPMNDYYKVVVETTEDTFTVKLDISRLSVRADDGVLSEGSGNGDIIMEGINKEITNGIKKFTLKSGANNKVLLTVAMAEGVEQKWTVTGAKIENVDGKAIITLSGTFEGFTKDEFKDLLGDKDETNVGFRIINAGTPNWSKVAGPISNEVGDGTFSVKFDVTAFEARSYYVNQQEGSNTDIKTLTVKYDETITIDEKSYQLQGTPGSNVQLTVKSLYTFSAPTSAKLELMNDKGGAGEDFENEIERAFFVISGTYTGAVTEDIAKEYFKKDNYPFEFGIYNSTKDRIRRISIDTEAHTYTVKFDVTWLPAGEHICRFGPAGGDDDLKLSLEACPDNSVKSVGSTYTLTNYYGQEGAAGHWGCIYLKIERNYAVSEVKLEDAEGTPTLVVNGTFESDKFSKEDIKKFLEDEDVRSMCVDLNKDGWKNMTTVVTTGDGTFTVKMDLSSLEIANGYLVCTDCSGYGDIKTEYTGTITAGGKIYTFGKDTYGNLTIDVTEAPKPVEKTFTPTEVTLEVAEDSSKVYVVIKANVTGYSEEDLQTMVYIGEVNKDPNMKITVSTVSIADGVATVKFDFTGKASSNWWWGHYTIGEGDQTDLRVTVTEVKEYVGEYSYRLFNQDGMTIVEIKQEAKPAGTITFTGADLVEEGGKVYLVVTATFTGYTQRDLNTFVYVGETDKDPGMKFTVETATIEGDTVTLKFDFTGRVSSNWWWANYSIGEDTGRINCTFTDETITSGEYKYELKHNNSDQVIVVISNAE